MNKPNFLFGDIVVVEGNKIGVIVKTWESLHYDVYVRMYNSIKIYDESQIDRYRVRHKYLDEQEMGWQNG